MPDLNGLIPPSPDIDIDFSPIEIPGAVHVPGHAPAIILEGSGAEAHFVWSIEPESLPDDRLLPKSREEQISG